MIKLKEASLEWAEFEGMGCCETSALNLDIRSTSLWPIVQAWCLSESALADLGLIRGNMKRYKLTNNTSLSLTNYNYSVIIARITSLCSEINHVRLNTLNSNFNQSESFAWSAPSVYEASIEDCLSGFWSFTIEALLVLIREKLHSLSLKETKEVVDVLLTILISSQEYDFTLVTVDQLITFLPQSDYAKNLILYIKTITAKEKSKSFAQLLYLSHFQKYLDQYPSNYMQFLLHNQRAFCYATLGDNIKAITEESRGLRVSTPPFSQYICFLNLARLFIRLNKGEMAILVLLCAFCSISSLENQKNYSLLVASYLSRIAAYMGSKNCLTWCLPGESFSGNWRLAQALGCFQGCSNYLYDQDSMNIKNGVDIFVFNGLKFIYVFDDLHVMGLDKCIDIVEKLKDQSVVIGPYLVFVEVESQSIEIAIDVTDRMDSKN